MATPSAVSSTTGRRILWTHNFDPDIANAGVFMFEAARALADRGAKPELMYLGDLRSPLGIARAIARVREAAPDFDLVHAQFGSACALVTSRVGGIPKAVSIRGSDWVAAHSSKAVWRAHGRLAVAMTKLSLTRYELIVTVSNRIAAEVQSRGIDARVVVLPDPIDLQKFSPLPKADARSALGLPNDGTRYVLFTAINSNAANKRRELAESAIATARQRIPELEILVATGRSHDDMPTLVSAADVAICTSTAEGWPNSIKEALACNVPFVATDVSDLGMLAAEEPSCFVAEATPEALGDALVKALDNTEAHDLRSHLSGMTMDAFADGLLNSYARLLERHTDADPT